MSEIYLKHRKRKHALLKIMDLVLHNLKSGCQGLLLALKLDQW
jgi:hypothetical protein